MYPLKTHIPVIALFLLLCIAAGPAAALADLAVLTFDPPAGPVERTFAIPNAVENRGTTAAGSFTVGFVLSSDAVFTPADTIIGTRSVPSLAAGTATLLRTTNVTVPASVPAGTYYLAMAVDIENEVAESNKTNNLRADPDPVVVPAPPAPDLGPGFLFAYDAAPPGSFQVDGEVGNYGAAPAGTFTVGIYLSRDTAITTADVLLGTTEIAGLAAGSTGTVDEYVTVPGTVPGGAYHLGMVIDTANSVAESNEANNAVRATNPVTVPETPPGIAWQRLIGGTRLDSAHSVQQTPDGGYILLGDSLSRHGRKRDRHDQRGNLYRRLLAREDGRRRGHPVAEPARRQQGRGRVLRPADRRRRLHRVRVDELERDRGRLGDEPRQQLPRLLARETQRRRREAVGPGARRFRARRAGAASSRPRTAGTSSSATPPRTRAAT